MRILILFMFCSTCLFGQIDFEKEYEKQYAINITKEYLNDVYIPIDLEDAFSELNRLASSEALTKFKNADEEVIRRKLHFGVGRWISVNWNFEAGSRFSHYMKEMGVTFPDDMTEMTIVSFHRHLNGTPLMLKQQSEFFFAKRKKENEERKKKAKELVVKNN